MGSIPISSSINIKLKCYEFIYNRKSEKLIKVEIEYLHKKIHNVFKNIVNTIEINLAKYFKFIPYDESILKDLNDLEVDTSDLYTIQLLKVNGESIGDSKWGDNLYGFELYTNYPINKLTELESDYYWFLLNYNWKNSDIDGIQKLLNNNKFNKLKFLF